MQVKYNVPLTKNLDLQQLFDFAVDIMTDEEFLKAFVIRDIVQQDEECKP